MRGKSLLDFDKFIKHLFEFLLSRAGRRGNQIPRLGLRFVIPHPFGPIAHEIHIANNDNNQPCRVHCSTRVITINGPTNFGELVTFQILIVNIPDYELGFVPLYAEAGYSSRHEDVVLEMIKIGILILTDHSKHTPGTRIKKARKEPKRFLKPVQMLTDRSVVTMHLLYTPNRKTSRKNLKLQNFPTTLQNVSAKQGTRIPGNEVERESRQRVGGEKHGVKVTTPL